MNREALKNRAYMKIAETISELGTCCRAKVGCVLLRKNGTVAGVGYNGAPAGMPHCEPSTCNSENRCIHTSHAEENALFNSTGTVTKAYVTHEPCLNCARMLVRRGVREIFYKTPYSSIPEREREERDRLYEFYSVSVWQLQRRR